MKKLVFKYFDEFCFGELIADNGDDNWIKPFNKFEAFGYSTNDEYLFYNGELLENVMRMFSVGRDDFKKYFVEWFKDRYGLPVKVVL